MKQRLTDIETGLLRIDSATFQRLCDEYLFCRYGADFRHITRTGTQTGKMQTTKGTPDSYVVLPNGQYVLIEYTKQQNGLVKKLSEDVAKCLNSQETGLKNKQIDRILIIHAGKLSTEDDKILREGCLGSVNLEVIGLDELALSVHNDFRQLARRYLDVPYDTLQLQTPDEFIAEHTRKAVGENNPLTNPLRHREVELQALLAKIELQDITVLTGGPGVGKTRLALEALREFCLAFPDYEPFCIANKFAPLLEDLNDIVRPKKKYIFLIDDANRQTPILLQTIEYLYAKSDVSFKIILTVRDYAIDIVRKHLQPYRWDSYVIEKFTDEQIVELISQEPFKIGHQSFQQRIRDLANGNPRLAIMAAKLALKEQNLLALNDATDLYVSYYDNLTDGENNSLLADATRLKVLGLLAVFRQIDLLNEPFIERLIRTFGLSRNTLVAELAGLEKDELADVYLTDQNFFRLSDQNLATYAVYQVFVEKKLLSVEALLLEFFEDFPYRIRDSFYGVMNAFDQHRIIGDIKQVTTQYYRSVLTNDAKAYNFLNIFFFALPIETLEYLHSLADQLPSLMSEWGRNILHRDINSKDGPFKDRLRLLFHFFENFNDHFDTALELLVHFVERYPEAIPMLSDLIKNRLAFRPEDSHYVELRQSRLLNYLIAETKSGRESAQHLLFGVLSSFLQTEFQSTSSRGRGITITTFPYPLHEPFSTLRSTLWQLIGSMFSVYPDLCKSILFAYRESYSPRDNEAIRKFDRDHIIPLIDHYLTPRNFDDCHFVNEYIRFLNRSHLQSKQADQLAKRFRNRGYTLFLQLDWNRIRGREARDEMWDKPEQYKQKKRKELQKTLQLNSLAAVETIFDDILILYSKPLGQTHTFADALEAILSAIAEQNLDLFKQAIIAFSERDWPIRVPISYILSQVFGNEILIPHDWLAIFSGAQYRQAEWQLSFFSMVPASRVNVDLAEKLIQFFQDQSLDGFYLPDKWWQNYRSVNPKIHQNILTILSRKYDQTGMRYILYGGFFEERIDQFEESDLPLLKKIYLQLFKMDYLSRGGFDYNRNNLKVLLSLDPSFLIDFVEAHYTQSKNNSFGHPEIENLAFVWSLPNPVKWAMAIVRVMKSKRRFELHGRNYEPFFINVRENQREITHDFLREYIRFYKNDVREIDNIVQALQHIHKYEEWLLCIRAFLTFNQSVEAFKKISWAPSSLSGSGKMNFDQERANRLKQVLDQVKQMPKRLPYLKHISYLEWYITIHEQAAERERRRQFGEDD